MFPKRKHLPILALVGLPLLGVTLGVALAALHPPQNPMDYWPDIGALGAGFGVVGLLFGYLASLWLRGRILGRVAVAAIAIPFCVFGWFINGKGGRWDIAWWFGLLGLVATLTFLLQSLAPIGDRNRNSSGT